MLTDQRYTFDRVVRLVLTFGVFYGMYKLVAYLGEALTPFAIALLLAYLLDPVVTRVQKKVPNRMGAVAVTLAAVFGSLILMYVLVQPMVAREANRMGALLSSTVSNGEIAALVQQHSPTLWEMAEELASEEGLQELLASDDLLPVLNAAVKKILPGFVGLARGATSLIVGIFGFFVILLYLVFLLGDFQKVRDTWQGLIPGTWREGIVSFLKEFDLAMNLYFRGQAVVAMITGVVLAVGWSIIGLPMGIVLGLLAGVLCMVPYLSMLILIPATLLAVMQGLDPESGRGLVLSIGLMVGVFGIAQLLQDIVLVPRIMGKVTGLSPAIILLSISVWGKLLGFLGVIIALPMTCLVLAYYQRYLKQIDDQMSAET